MTKLASRKWALLSSKCTQRAAIGAATKAVSTRDTGRKTTWQELNPQGNQPPLHQGPLHDEASAKEISVRNLTLESRPRLKHEISALEDELQDGCGS